MKKIFVLFCCCTGFLSYSQEVQKEFTKVLLDEHFTNGDKNWNSTFNVDNLFIAQNGYYELFRRSKKSGYYLLPNDNINYSAFELESSITFLDHTNRRQSAGVLMMAKDNSSGLLLEINGKKEFRVLRIYNDRQVPKTGTGEGWLSASGYLTKTLNTIMVKTYDKVYDIYFNNKFIFTFTEIELNKGMVGLYIGPDSKAKFDYLKIKGEDKTDLSNIEISNKEEEEQALTQIIVNLKVQINKKDKEIDELKSKLKMANNGSTYGNKSDSSLLAENRLLNSKVGLLESENEDLQLQLIAIEEEKKNLEEFKSTIQNGQENGDILINLSNIITSQKLKIVELEMKTKSLNDENNSLFLETKDLTKQLDDKTNKLTSEQAKNIRMKYELDSLKKTIANLNDSLKAKNEVIIKKEKVPEKEISDEERLQQLIEKEREERIKKREEEEKKKKEEADKVKGND